MTMTETRETPQVWIGCLACYNAGRLLGCWYDADEAGDVTTEQVHRDGAEELYGRGTLAVRDGDHEELWVFDHEGFGGLLDGECSPVKARQVAEVLDKLQLSEPVEAFAAWVADMGQDADMNAVEGFREQYCGEWASEAEYAQQFAEDIGAVRDDFSWPLTHIDWEGAAQDLFIDDYWSAPSPNGVFVFNRNA